MQRISASAVIGLSAILLARTAIADPGPVVNYLIAAPVSQFSFGLFRIESALQRYVGSEPLNPTAEYDWDTNKIVVSLSEYLQPPDGLTKDRCKELVNKARLLLGVNAETGEPYSNFGASSMGTYFSPMGYSFKSEPKDFGKKLDAITEIRIALYPKEQSDGTRKCQGPLIGKEVLFPE